MSFLEPHEGEQHEDPNRLLHSQHRANFISNHYHAERQRIEAND